MPHEADGASWQQFLDFIAEDGFGEHRRVEKLVADVVFRTGLACQRLGPETRAANLRSRALAFPGWVRHARCVPEYVS